LKKWSFALASGFLAATMSMPASADIEDFAGVWEYKDLQTAGVSRLEITEDRNTLEVRTLGACGVQCDWGTVQATYFPERRNKDAEEFVLFQQDAWNTENMMILKPAGPGEIRLEFFRNFPQGGSTNFSLTYVMTKVPGAKPGQLQSDSSQAREECIGFDTNQIRAMRSGPNWKVAAAAVWLLESTSGKGPAEVGTQVIKHYGMDRQCMVGSPEATMHYYLVNGSAPSGQMPGEDCIAFKNKKIRDKNGLLLTDDGDVIFDFQGNRDEARRAKKIVKKYGFANVCFINRDNPRMVYFRK
jgi:hypothetical protein